MVQSLKDEIGKREPFDLLEEEAYLNLARTCSVLSCQFARLFRAQGLSEATYNILRILRGESAPQRAGAGVPMQTIGERLIARVPDVTRLVDRLERSGLVQRTRTSEDRRVVLVSITVRGIGLLSKLDEPVRELHRRQLGHLSKRDLEQLTRLLVRARHPEDE
jgi:MarR family transcriptional regulator, 2-MHQ and catechol-resistance regulon repressor